MQKRSNKYYLTLSLKEYANGETEPAKELGIEFDNHDEIFDIIEKIKAKNLFENPHEATQFALGLKLFSEIKLKHRNNPLFEELNEVFPVFMKKLKSL
ncbi:MULTISPECIES: DUF3861 domain-containing protein [Flavobacterium]|jgi:hypothetical protein|uniref:DUF3861 family protein n=2 Tax=Flavobacterium TaxID=237 RepID=A0A1S1J319_9FLAO|nr:MULTISPECIES: DUF3861 domain-containing protein [Flavobacterium]MCC9019660.1 DUF3861 domain-containing protein [Flavobacterium sp. F-126]MDL2142638.1 DUF3861 domain-containing protein [Flavobacterium tructae]OHT43859.1 hypothetical protein BHE19_16085 [Flavobacterium tructae]OXB21627.1 hypothetical protein B0A71_03735 [Flavobacterium tructae]OXB23080.1 hypothetical protein B0A80_12915 [Flavobacterium tructae]